ncbi:hypothetical protein T440DRAFT_504127 [Plenodomus tracheiphilus IPT5]|uniref:Dpy-30 domain-containing protein n=1 Tax=Plenodomus tracheiphilus IPT5 TaxID=1408161 RepID=A0A6A7BJ03_9PLEO|nr:hypothetical protein T440DRAFT_504127 [Plenodomus tracheiphilus IPT5]
MADSTQDPIQDPTQLQAPETEAPQTNGHTPQTTDVEMADSTTQPELPTDTTLPTRPDTTTAPELPPSTLPTQPSAPSPAPTQAPSSFPAPASSRNSPHPSAPAQAPTQPIPHGSPTRVYLNQNVTPHLLEAMKHLATTEPEKPLKWLSEFLARKSAEIEGV